MTTKTMTGLRIDNDLLTRIDALAEGTSGLSVPRSEVIRLAIRTGLDVLERDRAARGACACTLRSEHKETVEALRTLRTNTMSSWSGCVDTAGITDCGASHDEARAQDAADAADAAEGHWDRAIEAVESGDIATAKQELEWARSLAAEWGDSTCETQALEVVDQAGGGDDDDEEDIDDCYIRTVRHA